MTVKTALSLLILVVFGLLVVAVLVIRARQVDLVITESLKDGSRVF
ncbi:hypothetical protein HY419_02370 [candidate division WWE3 bacterium]|nr:hypothetical protein [candidate division WWE3 bacterium]